MVEYQQNSASIWGLELFCPNCGKETFETDNFCKLCGYNLATNKQASPASAEPATPPEISVKNPRIGKDEQIWGMIIFVVGMFLVFAGVGESSVGPVATIGGVTVAVGLFIYLIGRFKHWYHAE